MAIINQGILGGFKKKIGSVVGSSWKGIATMRSLPLSVANPRTAAQVSNRDRFKACAAFASLILASIIKPLMDRFAGKMSGYNFFTKLNKDVWSDPSSPTWADLVISKGKIQKPMVSTATYSSSKVSATVLSPFDDRYALPTDKIYCLVYNSTKGIVAYAGDTGNTRNQSSVQVTLRTPSADDELQVYFAYCRADGTDVSNNTYNTIEVA